VRPICILARLTFLEAVRRRIVLTGLVLGVCFLLVYSIGFHLIISQMARSAATPVAAQAGEAVVSVARSEGTNTLLLAGLYAVAFLSIAMAALLGADTLAGEIRSGTMQTVVTKPIRRSAVVYGKWLGFAGLLALYLVVMAAGTMLSVWLQTGYAAPHFLAGLLLMYLETLLVMTISLVCSSALSGLATGGVVFGLYGLAFIGGWIEQFGSMIHNQAAVQVGIVASLIIPSESLWRRAAFEMQSPIAGALGLSPFGTISVPSLLMLAYAVLYLAAALALTVRIFNRREL
jgi:ABC-type transport system involved in multi-copper enzyme maturation permease subunit